MKRMLINATQQEELRMAMVDGQRLYDLNIEAPASERKKANIYKGRITRIEPSLEAAFVDYGADRHGFLPLKEISSEYFVKTPGSGGKPNIKEVLKEGQDIVVQVDKEERGNKGAALTTFVSLAGRFIVLKPNKARSGGVSRRITGDDRDLARRSLNSIEVPDGMSVILRTAGIDRSAEELAWDLENLLTVWTAILNVVLERPSPFLIYRESDSVVRALRDYLTNDIGEILIDDEQTYKEACEHVEATMPHNLRKLKHYTDPVPLFTRFQIETQIESAFAHTVHLPSGGSIVIDHTEALVSIDINSARATKGGDIEATALNTNLEAAEEISRQLRIRDLGGLIVIDFIDMGPSKHQRDVENRLREAVRQDRARVQIGKISRFGLLEMSRQRLRPSIGESAHITCPRCSGFGNIRSVESLALAILRIVGEESRKERTAKVIAQLPVEVSTYLLNEKRDWVQSLEDSNDTQIVLVANPLLETPHYEVRRVRDDQVELPENTGASYQLFNEQPEPEAPQAILERKAIEAPAVATLKPSTPAPKREEPKPEGFFSKILSLFTSSDDDKERKKPKAQQRRKKDAQPTRGKRAQQSKRRADSRREADERGPQRKKTKKKAASKKTAKKKTAQKKSGTQDAARKDKAATKDAPKKQAEQKAAPAQQDKADETQGEAKRTSRSRRGRGARRRRRASDKPEQVTDTRQPAAEAQEAARSPAASGEDARAEKKPEPKEEQKPAPKAEPQAKAEPPKADKHEGAAEKKPQAAPEPTAAPDAARQPAERGTGGGNGADTAAPAPRKLLPWETQQLPVTAQPAAEPQAKAESKPKPEPQAKPEQESEPRPKPESQAKAKPKPERQPEPQAKAEPKPQPKPEPQAKSEQQSEPKPKPEPKAELKPEPKPEASPPAADRRPAEPPPD